MSPIFSPSLLMTRRRRSSAFSRRVANSAGPSLPRAPCRVSASISSVKLSPPPSKIPIYSRKRKSSAYLCPRAPARKLRRSSSGFTVRRSPLSKPPARSLPRTDGRRRPSATAPRPRLVPSIDTRRRLLDEAEIEVSIDRDTLLGKAELGHHVEIRLQRFHIGTALRIAIGIRMGERRGLIEVGSKRDRGAVLRRIGEPTEEDELILEEIDPGSAILRKRAGARSQDDSLRDAKRFALLE